ncbi:carboxypeptidase-like regulatory domain-containing protein [Bremerella alba]|uniref:Lipoprotein n=1 Tax=Bremerella alba TaxID=980252 RepID=A0A7V8V5K7_9BACT|nr:carboxypeptidase-like regulatory domain-containing protein [Bremerella alba]MBA2115181.1 hypothetical protein [Bremerella alba]
MKPFQSHLNRSFLVLLIALITSTTIGCFGSSSDGPDLAEVSGVVTMDGAPLQNIQVLFQPEADAGASRGLSDADGKFRVYYPTNSAGAVPGKHRVQFQLMDANATKDIVPKRYAVGSQGIPVDVTLTGPNEFTFDLAQR